MARTNVDAWVPEQRGSAVLLAVQANSAVEAVARPEPMTTDTKTIPRDAGVDVAVTPKGSAYTENDQVDDEITLKARKFTGLLRIADEDLQDIPENIVAQKQQSWASAYAKRLDFAALATTPAEDGLAVPFTSVYAQLAAADAGLGYAAGANIVKTTTGVALTYDDLSAAVGLVEDGDYFADGEMVAIAHPTFRGQLRGIKDANGHPIFVQGLAGTPDTLFGMRVLWSAGAKTGTDVRVGPTGNALLVVANRNMLVLGKRSGPEFAVVNGFTGAGALTDEALIKARSRRAFALAHPGAAAVLELVP